MAITTWLIDKSAYTRLVQSPDAQTWIERIEHGMVRISSITRLEIGYSFRTATEARNESVSPPLALSGQHRAPAIPDLLVAALAEIAGLTVLALDKDFELIAQITGQPVERLRLSG